jgi:hypothetical protein
MDVVTERSQMRPPYQAYAAIMGVYAGGLALAAAAERLLGRDPRDHLQLGLRVHDLGEARRADRS